MLQINILGDNRVNLTISLLCGLTEQKVLLALPATSLAEIARWNNKNRSDKNKIYYDKISRPDV